MLIKQIKNFSDTAFLCLVEFAPQSFTQLIVTIQPDGLIDFGPINPEFTNLPGFDRMKEDLQKYANGEPLVLELEYVNVDDVLSIEV